MSLFSTAGHQGIPDSGVARWSFDDEYTEKGNALDQWGDNIGTINGATTGVSGITGYGSGEAYDFDGSSDYVSTGYTPDFGTGGFTVAVWYNADVIPSNSQSTLLGTYNDSSESGGIICGFKDGTYRFWINGDNIAVGNPNENTDTFAVFVRRGGKQFVFEDSVEISGSSSDKSASTSTDGLYIGRRNENDHNFDGVIDDVRIYDRGLADQEISDLFSTGSI